MQFLPPVDTTEKSTYGTFQFGEVSQTSLQATSMSFDAMLEQSNKDIRQVQSTISSTRSSLEEQARDFASNEAATHREIDHNASNSFKRIEKMRDQDAPGDVQVTKTDIDAMRKNLKKQGFSDEDIDALQEKAASQSGLTWSDFIGVVQQKIADIAQNKGKVDLSQEDRNNLLSFFQKAGFGPKKAEQLVEDIADGKGAKVMTQLQNQLSKLPADSSISVNKEELGVLLKAFQANDTTAANIASLLQKAGSNDLSPDALKNAIALLQKDMSDQGKADAQAMNDLQKDIRQLLDKAMNKLEAGQSDSAKLIHAAKDEKAAANFVGKDSDQAANQDKGEKDPKESAKSAEDALKAKLHKVAGEAAEKTDSALQSENASNDSNDRDWDTFFDKITARLEGGNLNLLKNAQGTREAVQTAKPGAFDAKTDTAAILKQIENGVLKSSSDGVKQLTIQLKPLELGTVQVMLNQSSNGELKGVIRTENADVTKVVAEQLAQVKETLAQQGIKVSELEVQTGLSRDSMQQQWNGQQQHNLDAEREAMARIRTRMRNLRGEVQAANISHDRDGQATRRLLDQGRVHYVA